MYGFWAGCLVKLAMPDGYTWKAVTALMRVDLTSLPSPSRAACSGSKVQVLLLTYGRAVYVRRASAVSGLLSPIVL
jgi:hypothetical protein